MSILRTALKHAQIESFNKEQLYKTALGINPPDNYSYFYHHDLIIEAIIDSIIDQKEYTMPADYKKYLSVNMDMIDDYKPDTMKILRYFYLYNFINGKKQEMEEIETDMIFQQNKAYERDESLSNMSINLGNRWLDEIKSREFHLLMDEKHSLSLNFVNFQTKRKNLEKIVTLL